MTAPNLASVVLLGERLNHPAKMADVSLVEPAFVALVEGLARLQSETGSYFRVREDVTARDVAVLGRMLHALDGGGIKVSAPESLDFTATSSKGLKPVGDVYEHLAWQFWHSQQFLGEEVSLGPCYALGGPWEVEKLEAGDGGVAVKLSPTPDTQWVMRRGSLTEEPILPGGQGRILSPRESP